MTSCAVSAAGEGLGRMRVRRPHGDRATVPPESGLVAGVLLPLTSSVAVLVRLGRFVARIGGTVPGCVAVLVGFGGFGGDVIIVEVAHAPSLPPQPPANTNEVCRRGR